MKKLSLLCLVFIFLLGIFVNAAETEEPVTIELPDTVSYLKPFQVKITFNDPNFREYVDVIVLTSGNSTPSHYIDSNQQLSDELIAEGYDNPHRVYEVNGEKEIVFTVVPTVSSIHILEYLLEEGEKEFRVHLRPIWNDKEEDELGYSSKGKLNTAIHRFKPTTSYKLSPLEKDISLPPEYTLKEERVFGYYVYHDTKNEDNLRTDYAVSIVGMEHEGTFWLDAVNSPKPGEIIEKSYQADWKNYREGIYPSDDWNVIIDGKYSAAASKSPAKDAYMFGYTYTAPPIKHWDAEQEKRVEAVYIKAHIKGFIYYSLMKVRFELTKGLYVPVADAPAAADEAFAELRGIIESYTITDNVAIETFSAAAYEEIEDGECGECREGYVCSVCGDCIKKGKAVFPDDLRIDANLKLDMSSSSIKNTISAVQTAKIKINPILMNKFHKEVKYCQLTEKPEEIKLYAEVIEDGVEEPTTGFTSGGLLDKRENETFCVVDLEDKDKTCTFIIAPKDNQKIVGEVQNAMDAYIFTLKDKDDEITAEAVASDLKIVNPDIKLHIKSKNTEVEQGTERLFQIQLEDKHSKNAVFKVSMVGPGHFGWSRGGIGKTRILDVLPSNEWHNVVYQAPAMGNFDIGAELNSLSMTKLQTQAAFQIAEDAIGAYGGEFADKMGGMVESGEYLKQMGDLVNAYKITNGVKSLKGFNKGIPDLAKDVGNAMQVEDGKKEAGFIENTADYGIAGIGMAQTAMSVLTFVPNKIPGVNKLTGNFQVAFSAMTNIWKANLIYISQSEKIERAEVLFYPVVFIVTAKDESGWVTQETLVFKIAYQEVN